MQMIRKQYLEISPNRRAWIPRQATPTSQSMRDRRACVSAFVRALPKYHRSQKGTDCISCFRTNWRSLWPESGVSYGLRTNLPRL